MSLQIRGCQLPGRTWRSRDEHHDNVHVGIQGGKQPRELVPADAETSSWTIPIEVVARETGLDLRGTAVHGGPGARFVYLTWGDVGENGSFAMFRRAKLTLAARIAHREGRRLTRRSIAFAGSRCPRTTPIHRHLLAAGQPEPPWTVGGLADTDPRAIDTDVLIAERQPNRTFGVE